MKRIIITRSQLNEVMDSQKTKVTFDGTNASDLGANAQEKYNDAIRTGLKPNSIQMDGKTVNNNASDKDETVINIDTNQGNLRDAVTNSVNNAVNNGADINKLNIQGNSEDIMNGTNESKRYSKQQVERARLYEMRKNGIVMTKKQLTEGLFSSPYMEGKPQKISDVFKGNGWKYRVIMRNPDNIIVRCYTDNNNLMRRNYLPFEELVEDLNIYFQDKNSRCRAQGMEEYNGVQGAFISIMK